MLRQISVCIYTVFDNFSPQTSGQRFGLTFTFSCKKKKKCTFYLCMFVYIWIFKVKVAANQTGYINSPLCLFCPSQDNRDEQQQSSSDL